VLLRVQALTRNRSYLVSRSLLPRCESAWRHLCCFGDDMAFRCTTGFSRHAYDILLECFVHDYKARRLGGPTIEPGDALGLILHWLNSTMRAKTLSMLFSIPSGSISRVLQRALHALSLTLARLPEASIRWPSVERMEELAERVALRVPGLGFSCFGFVDGVKFPVLEASGDTNKQNAYYNGWKKACFVSNVIVTGSDGCILWAKFNCPGSWNDANIASSLFRRLRHTPAPYAIVGDTAFPRTGAMEHKIYTPCTDAEFSDDPVELQRQLQQHRKVTSIRQAAEWSMHSLQGSFGRLQIRLHWDDATRHDTISCILHLHNFRIRVDAIGQVATVFDPRWVPSLLADSNFDRVARYYRIPP